MKNEANIRRITLQTKETPRNYSFVSTRCSETTNKERGAKKESGRGAEFSRIRISFPQKAFDPFCFISAWKNELS